MSVKIILNGKTITNSHEEEEGDDDEKSTNVQYETINMNEIKEEEEKDKVNNLSTKSGTSVKIIISGRTVANDNDKNDDGVHQETTSGLNEKKEEKVEEAKKMSVPDFSSFAFDSSTHLSTAITTNTKQQLSSPSTVKDNDPKDIITRSRSSARLSQKENTYTRPRAVRPKRKEPPSPLLTIMSDTNIKTDTTTTTTTTTPTNAKTISTKTATTPTKTTTTPPNTPSPKSSSTKKKNATTSSSSSSSRKKRQRILPNSQPPPTKNWYSIYTLVQELRSDKSAPVDTDGSHALPERHLGDDVYRYQVLIALMLSSQTKDAVVGETMRALQKHGLTPQNIQNTPHEKLNQLLNKVGFHNNKTKYIKEATSILLSTYNADIPPTADEMMKLPGVGPKMAYIIESVAFNTTTGIGVDTHMHRMFNQLKWVNNAKTPEQTREQLEGWLPRDYWAEVNVLWVGFGQETQQQKEKALRKAFACSRPVEALGLYKKVGMDIKKEAKRFGLEEEVTRVMCGGGGVSKK